MDITSEKENKFVQEINKLRVVIRRLQLAREYLLDELHNNVPTKVLHETMRSHKVQFPFHITSVLFADIHFTQEQMSREWIKLRKLSEPWRLHDDELDPLDDTY